MAPSLSILFDQCVIGTPDVVGEKIHLAFDISPSLWDIATFHLSVPKFPRHNALNARGDSDIVKSLPLQSHQIAVDQVIR